MSQWYIFELSIGFLVILLSHSTEKPMFTIIGGLALIVHASINLRKSKANQGGEANENSKDNKHISRKI